MATLEETRGRWEGLGGDFEKKGRLLEQLSFALTPEAEDFIAGVLDDAGEYDWVRGVAARCLSNAREDAGIDALLRNIAYSFTFESGAGGPEDTVFRRAMCAQALGENIKWRRESRIPLDAGRQAQAEAAIIEALKDDAVVCAKAVAALARLGHSEARVKLINEAFIRTLSPDVAPVAEAYCEMGMTQPFAVGFYLAALHSGEEKLVEKIVGVLERALQENPWLDRDGRMMKELEVRKRMLATRGRPLFESIVDELLGARFSAPHVAGTTQPRLPAQKLK
ncbi:MAG: hypothetical protein AB1657_02890 [Candidatus Micrarchaeota archaeon]